MLPTKMDSVLSMPRQSLRELVRSKRAEEGLSQEALARQIGVTRGSVSQIETGLTLHPTASVLLRLARALHVSDSEVFEAAGETPRKLPGTPYDTWQAVSEALGQSPDLTPEQRRGLEVVFGPLVRAAIEETRRTRARKKQAG